MTRQRFLLRLPVWTALAGLLWLSSATASGSSPTPVLTQHNNNSRTGANLTETSLNTTNVNVTQFGKLFARSVDGHVYAQILYVPGLSINAANHNVVFVATMHDTVYAFDADDPAASAPLWQRSLGTSAPITYTIPNTTTIGHDFGPPNYADIAVEIGILSTPVIDPNTNTLYVVAFTKEPNPATCPCHYAFRLHALDLATGNEKFGGPVLITGSVPGDGYDSVGGTITLSNTAQLQRPGLLLTSGTLYLGFGSVADWPIYHGWLIGYDATNLQQVSIFNSTPSSAQGGIWQSGQGPAVDANGHIYVMTANGLYSGTVTGDYGDSFIQLNPQGVTAGLLPVSDSFTPFDQAVTTALDLDLGSGGALLIPGTNLLLGGGKPGKLYLLNATDMGGYQQGPGGTDRVVQSFQATNITNNTGHIHGTPVYWNSPGGPRFYVWGEGEALKEYGLTINNPVSATIQTTPLAMGTTKLTANYMPGGFLSVSANGSTHGTGIVWASHPITNALHNISPGVLRAYNAEDVSQELWDSTQYPARDAVGNFAKFNPPTVANGRVYLATFSGQVLVYGLLTSPGIAVQPKGQTINPGHSTTLSVTAYGAIPLNYRWYQGVSGDTSHPMPDATGTAATFNTPALTTATDYWVKVSNTFGVANSTTALVSMLPPLPAPWTNTDIGYVGFPANATEVGGVFTITASGGDIWQTTDSFNFSYQPLYGDGWIAARVDSLENSDPWAKAGVMIRESLDPSAANALIAVTPGNGISFQDRATTGALTSNTLGSFVTAPYWVKLVRTGDVFSGYQSSDGVTWTLVAAYTIPMPKTVYVGLAVTAHNNALTTSAIFDRVTMHGTAVSRRVYLPVMSK